MCLTGAGGWPKDNSNWIDTLTKLQGGSKVSKTLRFKRTYGPNQGKASTVVWKLEGTELTICNELIKQLHITESFSDGDVLEITISSVKVYYKNPTYKELL